jgi:hypothetical protein
LPKLTVNSQPDAQILVIGRDLQILRTAVGMFQDNLDPGFYKIKCERGGGTVEQLLDLFADKVISLQVDRFPAIAPLVTRLGDDRDAVEAVAIKAKQRPMQPVQGLADVLGGAEEPGLLLMVHRLRDASEIDHFAGIRLGPWTSNAWIDPETRAGDTVTAAGEMWRAAWVPFKPGCYLLEIADGAQVVQQAVTVASGWQTRVFIRRRRWLNSAGEPLEAGTKRREWIDVSVQMARSTQGVVYDSYFETVEVARNALELTRPAVVTDRLINDLLSEKFSNPIAGMTGLHLFLEALERQRSPKSALPGRGVAIRDAMLAHPDALLDEAFRNLDKLLLCGVDGQFRDPSDVVALKVRAGRLEPNRSLVVTEPPMLWVSWDALRLYGGGDHSVEVAPDLWRRIAWASAWGPYLAWPPRETTLGDFLQGHLRAPEKGPKQMFQMPLLEGDDLVKALGIPPSVARSDLGAATLRSLADQSSPQNSTDDEEALFDIQQAGAGRSQALTAWTQSTRADGAVAGKLDPSYGPHSGGTKVSITGNGFTGASGVNFEATPGTDFKFENDGLVTVNSPPAQSKDNEAKVYVVFPSTSPPNSEVGTFYYYTIDPSHGPAAGGAVTIIGSGLKDVSAVKFGDNDGINLQPLTPDPSGREARAVTAPAGNQGSDVSVKLVFPVETANKISVVGTYHYD